MHRAQPRLVTIFLDNNRLSRRPPTYVPEDSFFIARDQPNRFAGG
jgi:hypothetical protein